LSVRNIIFLINKGIPTVERPKQRPSLKERMIWTGLVLIVYYLLSNIPLWGVPETRYDYLRELRLIFAGSFGSLIELGIGPIVTAGIVIELLVGSGIIGLDLTDPEDRRFFQAIQRVLSIVLIVTYSVFYVIGGRFGAMQLSKNLLVIAQLALGSLMLMMLDDLVSKWGIGSGISLFILAGVTTGVFWNIFAPPNIKVPETGRVVGVLSALFIEKSGAIYRAGLPDLIGLASTVIVILVVVITYGIRVNVPISHTLMRGQRTRYPIRLLYVSNVPIIFALALMGDIDLIAKIIWSRFSESATGWQQTLMSILGTFELDPRGQPIPVGGLAYYIATPRGPTDIIQDPLRSLIYLAIMVGSSVIFAKIWVITAGMDPESVSRQLVEQGLVLPGRRASSKVIAKVIEDYIESVTILGGALVGLLAAGANFAGAIGTGSGLLLGVTITISFYEVIARERMLELYPRLKAFLGV